MHFFSMIISLIHHHLRKGDEDMCLISQFSRSQPTKKSKKKFLNYVLGVEESRPKLRVRKKFRLKDPRYVNSTPFGAYWLKILYFIKPKKIVVYSMPKRTIFLCWLQKKSIYILYEFYTKNSDETNFALFVRKKNFWPFRDLRTIYVNIDITPAIIVTFVW